MNWWESFWIHLSAPAWVAGLLQATLGALIAFVGALMLFRRQLRHDRELASRQLQAEKDGRIAERRSVAADQLGRAMLAAVHEVENPSIDATAASLLRASSTRARGWSPGSKVFSSALDNAELTLPDLDSRVWDLWRYFNWSWEAALRATRSLDLAEGVLDRHGSALVSAFEELATAGWQDIVAVGKGLILWDGEGEPPVLVSLGPAHPFRGPAAPEGRSEWIAEFKRQMLAGYEARLAAE